MSEFKKDKTGEIHMSNGYGLVEILEHNGCHKCKIKFLEDGTIIDNQSYNQISRGSVRNPYKRVYYGQGYMGQGKYNTQTAKEAYRRWNNMLQRSYDTKYHLKFPTYKDVEICEEWKCFQNFAPWFEENYDSVIMKGWDLDKDLLSENSKFYSPETCCFLPQTLNKLLIHLHNKLVYMQHKDKYYPKICMAGENFWPGVCDSFEEADFVYKTLKKDYAKAVLEKYKNFLPEKVVYKINEQIDTLKIKIPDANLSETTYGISSRKSQRLPIHTPILLGLN